MSEFVAQVLDKKSKFDDQIDVEPHINSREAVDLLVRSFKLLGGVKMLFLVKLVLGFASIVHGEMERKTTWLQRTCSPELMGWKEESKSLL